MRGGSNLINTDYIDCGIEKGLRYLDNDRLREIIDDLYRYKSKGKVIYITATAACHLAKRYGRVYLALSYAINLGFIDVGVTNLYQAIRKTIVCVLVGTAGPLYALGGPIALVSAFILLSTGLRIAFTDLDSIDSLTTSPVFETGSGVEPRIPSTSDVVIVNNRKKITMSNPVTVAENKECWLPDQAFLNPNCKVEFKPTDIPDASDLVSPNLKYQDVVNMQDMTSLDKVDFSDVLDLGQTEPSNPKLNHGKEVNFLEKFGDSGTVNEKDTWNVNESPIPKRLRTRTRNEL